MAPSALLGMCGFFYRDPREENGCSSGLYLGFWGQGPVCSESKCLTMCLQREGLYLAVAQPLDDKIEGEKVGVLGEEPTCSQECAQYVS